MYGGRGGGSTLLGVVPTAAGVAVLPNTGDNHLLFAVSLLCVIVGAAVVVTSLVFYAAKKLHKA